MTTATATYSVPGMSCSHCEAAVLHEVEQLPGIESVDVDLELKLVHVAGSAIDDAAVRAAIEAAGYEATG